MDAPRPRRERLLTFLLLPAIVVAVVVLSSFSFRASFQLERLREQSVVEATLELANDRVARLERLIIDQDNAISSEVDVTALSQFPKAWLPFASRQTPTVRAVLVVDLDSELKEVRLFASRAPGPEDEAFRRLLVYEILPDLSLSEEPKEQLRHLHKTYEEQAHLVSYWQRRVDDRDLLVVVWHDLARIVHDYLPFLYQERDSQSRVNVVDSQGRIVFGPPLSVGAFTVGRPFESTLYKWRVNVALTSAQQLAERAARRRLLETIMAGLSALVVVLGILVILVAVARERKLSNLKSEFVANVSHDLKTPLSLVRMFAELLHSGRVDSEEKRKKYVQIIVQESERLGALIENVLDFARVERGRRVFDFAPGNLARVVESAVEKSQLRAEQEDIVLSVDAPPDLPEANLDEAAVELAVLNLIDNALKYAADGKVVQVAVRHKGNLLQVSVTDQGPGIEPEDRKRIFDRFVRGPSQTARGSGIGLALVRQIAQAHGGEAWVEPAAPSGASFFFTVATLKTLNRGSDKQS